MDEKKLTYVAHRLRDGKSLNPENSIEAYIDAINNPYVGGLELDIQRTKDGIFVLMNYKTIENVTNLVDNTKNKISDYTYEELNKFYFFANKQEIERVLNNGAIDFGEDRINMINYYNNLKNSNIIVKIPTLEEILKIDRNGKKLFIEIKTDYSKEEKYKSIEYAKDLINILDNHNLKDFVIIGRDTNTLEAIKQERQDIICCPVIGYNDPEKATYGFDGASVALNHLNMNIPYYNKPVWEYVLENGQQIAVWNLRTYQALKEADDILGATGVDYNPTGDFTGYLHEKLNKNER